FDFSGIFETLPSNSGEHCLKLRGSAGGTHADCKIYWSDFPSDVTFGCPVAQSIHMLMRPPVLLCWLLLLALPAVAQPAANSFPTKTESLLRRIATVVTTSSQPVGAVQGTLRDADTNIMTISVRSLSVTAGKTTEYAVTIQMHDTKRWQSPSTYVDYDEL